MGSLIVATRFPLLSSRRERNELERHPADHNYKCFLILHCYFPWPLITKPLRPPCPPRMGMKVKDLHPFPFLWALAEDSEPFIFRASRSENRIRRHVYPAVGSAPRVIVKGLAKVWPQYVFIHFHSLASLSDVPSIWYLMIYL